MIIGIGSDITNISRISNTIKKHGDRFLNKCFDQTEINRSKNTINYNASLAKRFAAKEALSKALGTGFALGINWRDIVIKNDKRGKPFIELKKNALKKLSQIIPKNKNPIIHLTISDESNIAYAMVIISCY